MKKVKQYLISRYAVETIWAFCRNCSMFTSESLKVSGPVVILGFQN